MKSLLRFVLMISLVVLGKLTQQPAAPLGEVSTSQSQWKAPVRPASLVESQQAIKRDIKGGGSRFWQATAPTAVPISNIE